MEGPRARDCGLRDGGGFAGSSFWSIASPPVGVMTYCTDLAPLVHGINRAVIGNRQDQPGHRVGWMHAPERQLYDLDARGSLTGLPTGLSEHSDRGGGLVTRHGPRLAANVTDGLPGRASSGARRAHVRYHQGRCHAAEDDHCSTSPPSGGPGHLLARGVSRNTCQVRIASSVGGEVSTPSSATTPAIMPVSVGPGPLGHVVGQGWTACSPSMRRSSAGVLDHTGASCQGVDGCLVGGPGMAIATGRQGRRRRSRGGQRRSCASG